VPQIEFIRKVFKECIKAGDVPGTWKKSRTVFAFKKKETELPQNWRPITITSCLYRLFMAMTAQLIQVKMYGTVSYQESQAAWNTPYCLEN
jgi:hypothetical protein